MSNSQNRNTGERKTFLLRFKREIKHFLPSEENSVVLEPGNSFSLMVTIQLKSLIHFVKMNRGKIAVSRCAKSACLWMSECHVATCVNGFWKNVHSKAWVVQKRTTSIKTRRANQHVEWGTYYYSIQQGAQSKELGYRTTAQYLIQKSEIIKLRVSINKILKRRARKMCSLLRGLFGRTLP